MRNLNIAEKFSRYEYCGFIIRHYSRYVDDNIKAEMSRKHL